MIKNGSSFGDACMKRFDVQLSSPETDRKIALPASIIFMSLAWVFFTGSLLWLLVAGVFADLRSWSLPMCLIVGLLGLGFVLVPVQLVRYFRSR